LSRAARRELVVYHRRPGRRPVAILDLLDLGPRIRPDPRRPRLSREYLHEKLPIELLAAIACPRQFRRTFRLHSFVGK